MDGWVATRDTFELYTQVIGKIRMACMPLVNHWWNVPLYVTARGLTTSAMPYGRGRGFQIDFDLIDHDLVIATTDGAVRILALQPRAGRASCTRPTPAKCAAPGIGRDRTARGYFYSYVYPEPSGYRDAVITPSAARFDHSLGEFLLPDRTLLERAAN